MLNNGAFAAVTCPAKPAGPVNIVWSSDNIEYDFTKTQSQMDGMENDTKSPYGRNARVHVGGLMKGGVGIQSQVQVATLNYPRTGEICQWIDKIDVRVKIDPKIYIARDNKPGSCRHKAILDHEMKHIFVDREIVKTMIPKIKTKLEKAVIDVGIVGPKNERDQTRYQNKINDYIESQIREINNALNNERRQKQQNIDTLAEYERVSKLCK